MNKTLNLFNLEGKNIIVAGGAGQIGFSLCEALAEAGARIAVADIDTELAVSKTGNLLDADVKERISIYRLDVRRKTQVDETLKSIASELGNIHGLVNCFHFKGNSRKLDTSSNFFSSFEHYPEEAWDLVHEVNLKGTFLMCQSIVPYMKITGEGVIVNLSSTYGNVSANKNIYGDSGINSPVSYATSKAAIINFTRYLATHLADYNIRANCLSPGGVFNNQSEDFIKNYLKLTPLKRMANPDDYQGAIVFLLSKASNYMTGANLIIDGGWTAW